MFFTRALAGVPKFRTSKPRILTRRFNSPFRQYKMCSLVLCSQCGASHEPWVLCMDCYRVLRDDTEPIKRRMVAHNAYIGQRQQPMQRWTDARTDREGEECRLPSAAMAALDAK